LPWRPAAGIWRPGTHSRKNTRNWNAQQTGAWRPDLTHLTVPVP